MMDEMNQEAAKQMPMLRALQKSIEHSINMGIFSGVGSTAVKSYRGLHGKIAEAMSEDPYITETLAYDLDDDTKDEQKLATVQMLLNQLVAYLEMQLHGDQEPERPFEFRKRKRGFEDIGRDLQGQLLNVTRSALRKAVISVDRGEDLTGQDLSGADLRGVDMSDSNFSGANLQGAILEYANLSDCNLRGANFSGANL